MGGFHDARKTARQNEATRSAQRERLLAIHHRAPAATSSARTCFCDLLARLVEMQRDSRRCARRLTVKL